jgi:hypothetical protein
MQIANALIRDSHGHCIAAAGAGWLRDQEHGESAGVFGSAAAQPLKLAALLRGAREVHLKLTVATRTAQRAVSIFGRPVNKRAGTLMWLPFSWVPTCVA